MKRILSFIAAVMLLVSGAQAQQKELVDYVNPYIGNISHLLVPTFATIQLPNSLMRVYPARNDYTTELVNGLPVVVTNHRERSAFSFSPTQDANLKSVMPVNWDNEVVTPYSMDIEMADNTMRAQLAVSHLSAIYDISFYEADKDAYLIITSGKGELKVENGAVKGYQDIWGSANMYICAETDVQPVEIGILENGKIKAATKTKKAKDVSIAMRFPKGTKKVSLRYGISLINANQAEANLHREQGDKFDRVAIEQAGRKEWNETLANIKVDGGTEDEKVVLYTSYYRTFERPVCLSEDGRYFSAFDQKVHEDGGTPFYTDDWIWDTYRAAHPLRALIQPWKEEDIIESYLRMAEQMGTKWMPTFPEMTGDTRRMNSNHGVAMVADAVQKGLKVDVERGYEYCKKGITEKTLAPWCGKKRGYIDDYYWEHGYIPALRPGEPETDPNVSNFEKRQPIAVTLGTAYDTWCLSVLADKLGKSDEAKYFFDFSHNYRTVYNAETAFFHPKDNQDKFLENFDYTRGGGIGARDAYDENNGWTYRWDVQHNFADLIKLMGGREQLRKNLDQTFAEPMGDGKREFYTQLPDQTGNIGQFTMANEPSLHIPYIYNYAGAPWKTQKRIRQCLKTWFRNDVMGIPGDEDGGGLTSFVVFSSLGFYPVTPGMPIYNIGSPLFSNIRVQLPNGKVFQIIANNCSEENKYIQSATLNGQNWDKPWFSHDDIKNGAVLILEMGKHPNKSWGAAPEMAPPSADRP
ncbi:MAG: GH92 family glycosyl hydrolase [Prevotellaceae bacterium]|nr:GH92 family glycosyl hydrolase [Prevotellaceae bacterium]